MGRDTLTELKEIFDRYHDIWLYSDQSDVITLEDLMHDLEDLCYPSRVSGN